MTSEHHERGTSKYTGDSDHASSPARRVAEGHIDRPSRLSKKIHNFGKRSNAIRRDPSAPVIKKNWLYKQDRSGMKFWKKRWFVLSDLCLFYYRDAREDGILGSILLPSFHISMLSVDDHINRKYAFKATHPNMRTYYFCTDTAKAMESWMKVMTEAALVQTEPVKTRLDRLKVEQCGPQEINHVANHRPPLTQPEIHNSERSREVDREHTAPPVSSQRSRSQGPDRTLTRSSSMQQLEQWVRTQRGWNQDNDTRSITSIQTMPRNMPSHGVPYLPQYGDEYRCMPRNGMAQWDSICSMSPSLYERALGPSSTDKRRSMRDDILWHLYEWQRRQVFNRHSGLYSNMASPKPMINLSNHALPSHSIPPSPSHGSLSMYDGYSPLRSFNMNSARSELSFPVYRRNMSMDGQLRPQVNKGPNYRLYKCKPELTTVAEVDESNGEDRWERPSDRAHSGNKGMSYAVGIVTPRTKSPVPDSSSTASYVTLKKGKKPESRTEHPHSAVEQQLSRVASGQPRMSVEEQLARIRRHQQTTLKDKKKGHSILSSSLDNTPSSFTKNHLHSTQSRCRDNVLSYDIQELETSLRQQEVVREHETPAEEIARLKEASHVDHFNVDRERSVTDKVLIPERYVELEPEEALSPEQEADKQRKVDRIKALIAKNSRQNVLPSLALSTEEKERRINISYEIAAEASKRSKPVAVRSLSSSSTVSEHTPSVH